MSTFEISGGKRLKGEITPQGAKNEALQVICASLLTPEKVTISNIPNIQDVHTLIEILKNLGVKINKEDKGKYSFQADNVNIDYLNTVQFVQQVQRLRGSLMIMGPLLSRFKYVVMPQPGGDKIGRRRIDTHFLSLEKLGAHFTSLEKRHLYKISAPHLKGTYILLDQASVTGTANTIMAAVLAKGKTTIYNAASEPYIQQLCRMLIRMGAKISGVGSNLLTIHGVHSLGGCQHKLLPDMIEVGSFIGLAALTQSDITIKNVGYKHLGIIPDIFAKLGIQMEVRNDNIHVPAQRSYEIEKFIDGSILTIDDAPWPAFPADLLSIALVTATQAKGSVLIHQKMFESRLFFVDRLIDMGAEIILCDPHRATVIGLDRKYPLRAIEMASPDIRAGVSMFWAALSAEGVSHIHNIEQIDRGYENIDIRLKKLGAEIKRINY